jgi:hypothetical protein
MPEPGWLDAQTASSSPPRRLLAQTFVKTVNYNHMMPTRYTLDLDLKDVVTPEALENSTKKVEARKVRGLTEERPLPHFSIAGAGGMVGVPLKGVNAQQCAGHFALRLAGRQAGDENSPVINVLDKWIGWEHGRAGSRASMATNGR